MAGTGVSAGFDAAEALEAAQAERLAIEAERLTMRVSGPTFCFDAAGPRLNISAVHAGTRPVEINSSSVIVDGVLKPTFTTSVAGRGATAIWTPGERAMWYVAGGDATRVVVVSPRGVAFNATKTTCLSYAHVHAMGTYTGDTPDTVFAKGETVTIRVTVRDQHDAPLSNVNVYVEVREPDTTLRCNCTAVTNSTGVATTTYTLPNANIRGSWTVRTTLITGTSVVYDPSANVVTQITFTEA